MAVLLTHGVGQVIWLLFALESSPQTMGATELTSECGVSIKWINTWKGLGQYYKYLLLIYCSNHCFTTKWYNLWINCYILSLESSDKLQPGSSILPLLCFADKVLLEHSCAYSLIVHGCFCATRTKLSSCDRDLMATKPQILTRWLFTENLCWQLDKQWLQTRFSQKEKVGGISYPWQYVYVHVFAICILSSDMLYSANKENRRPRRALDSLCPHQFCLTN